MNKIKAIMHNKVLYQMMQEVSDVDYIIVDEFAKEAKILRLHQRCIKYPTRHYVHAESRNK